jgi:hypothetical protein
MIRTLLVRGMGVGLVAALLAFAFSFLVGEPQVGRAIDLEAQAVATAGAAAEPEVVSRTVQRTVGLATAVGMYGLAIGGLFGIAFAVAYGRIGSFGPRAAAGLLALGGFVAVLALVPLYFVGAEEGATSLVSGRFVHEFVHDGRHLLGFPGH